MRLGKGEVQSRTVDELVKILPLVSSDPELPDDTVCSLLEVVVHIIARFKVWLGYPTALWKLTEKFNPEGYVLAIRAFLNTKEGDLDDYSLDLQRTAVSKGRMPAPVEYLMKRAAQNEIVGVIENASANSLEVERKHNRDKHHEKGKIATVAGASAKSVTHTFLLTRLRQQRAFRCAKQGLRKLKFMNSRALAIKKMPDLWARPRGHLRQNQRGDGVGNSDIVHAGDKHALDRFHAEHKEELKAEAAGIRARAKMAEQNMLSQREGPGCPLSNADWLDWFKVPDHMAYFRTLLQTATKDRRSLNTRLTTLEGGLPQVERIQAIPLHVRGPRPIWYKALLSKRRGFFCLKEPEVPDIKMVFVRSSVSLGLFWGWNCYALVQWSASSA